MSKDKNICEKCKAENTSDSSFCKKCGFSLDEHTSHVDYRIEAIDQVDETSIVDYDSVKKNIIADRYEIIEEVGRGGR